MGYVLNNRTLHHGVMTPWLVAWMTVIDVFSKKAWSVPLKKVGILTHNGISSPVKEQRWTTENADGQRKRDFEWAIASFFERKRHP